MTLIKEKMLGGNKKLDGNKKLGEKKKLGESTRELRLRILLSLTENEHKSLKMRPPKLFMKTRVYLNQ